MQARRGNHGTSRFVYLQRLVTEYQDTQKEGTLLGFVIECVEAKQQIIANLANFAIRSLQLCDYEGVEHCIVLLFPLTSSWTCFWTVSQRRTNRSRSLQSEAYATASVVPSRTTSN